MMMMCDVCGDEDVVKPKVTWLIYENLDSRLAT